MELAVNQEAIQGKETITADNAYQSPLLKLPQEIKDLIYVFVCGGNLLHLKFDSGVPHAHAKFRHYKCLSKTTEDDAQASFDSSISPWFDNLCANRHQECSSLKLFCDASGYICRRLTVDLRFLRTCRQIYDEEKNICYQNNIFSFDNFNCFVKFVETVNLVSYIRSIRLGIRSANNGDGPATGRPMKYISSKLTGLQWIYIDLEQVYCSDSRRYDQGAEEASHLTRQLLRFARPALKAAAVVISDARFCNPDVRSQLLNRWTMTQKQEYSRFLRNALLSTEARKNSMEGDRRTSRALRIWWNGTQYTSKHESR